MTLSTVCRQMTDVAAGDIMTRHSSIIITDVTNDVLYPEVTPRILATVTVVMLSKRLQYSGCYSNLAVARVQTCCD